MLEIILLILLCRKTGRLAESKGLRAWPWWLRLVLFWILGEFIGFTIGLAIFGRDGLFGIMLIGIAVALSSYFFIESYLFRLPDHPNDDINNTGR